jgi:hypothetical protein
VATERGGKAGQRADDLEVCERKGQPPDTPRALPSAAPVSAGRGFPFAAHPLFDSDQMHVRFCALCGLKSDIFRGPGCAIRRHSGVLVQDPIQQRRILWPVATTLSGRRAFLRPTHFSARVLFQAGRRLVVGLCAAHGVCLKGDYGANRRTPF